MVAEKKLTDFFKPSQDLNGFFHNTAEGVQSPSEKYININN